MRRTVVVSQLLVVAAFLVLLSGCKKDSTDPYGSGPTSPTTETTSTVQISGFAFSPASITVGKNTSVTWHNNDNVAHTATSDNGAWDTGSIAPGASKTVTFSAAGTFAYHCTPHPGMKATVIVQ